MGIESAGYWWSQSAIPHVEVARFTRGRRIFFRYTSAVDANAEEHAGTEALPGERPWQVLGPHGILRGWQSLPRPLRTHTFSNTLHNTAHAIGVYLHGFRSDSAGHKSLALVRHAHRRGRAWLRFDLSGHGASAGRFGDFRISRALADVEAALAALPTGYAEAPIVLVGSSLGAWLAVLATQRLPARIAGLVLLAPGFNFLQRQFAAMTPAAQAQWQSTGTYRFASHYDAGYYELEYAAVTDAARHDVLAQSLDLRCPVHVLHGDADEIVPLTVSEQFLAHLPGHGDCPPPVFTRIPGGDHRLTGADALIAHAVDAVWPAPKSFTA